MVTRLRSAAVAIGIGVATALLAPQSATAAPGDGDWQPADQSTQAGVNAPVTRQVRTCSLYAGGGSYGMTCRGAGSGSASYAEILAGEEPPDCWHEPVPEDFRVPRYAPEDLDETGHPKPGRWWLRTCLVGGLGPGPLEFSQEPEYLVRPEEPIRLTERQRLVLVGQFESRNIPEPFVELSPSATPRVLQSVAFSIPPVNRTGETIQVSGPGIGTVSMRARMTDLTIYPKGERPEPRVSCPDGGVRVELGETRATTPEACWYEWDRSSAHRSRGRYPVQSEATWVVEYEAGAGWTTLGTFMRDLTNLQPVTEVQTIVVP